MTQIEKGSQSVQKFVTLSNVLKHFDQTKLQRKIADMHVAFQVGSLPALEMWMRKIPRRLVITPYHVFTLDKELIYWCLETNHFASFSVINF